MESSTSLPRKYFVVVTHSPTLQLELEALLSSKRHNSFSTTQTKMFVESAPPSSTPKSLEHLFPNVEKGSLPLIKHDAQRILSAFESEWQATHIASPFTEVPSRAVESSYPRSKASASQTPNVDSWRLSNNSGTLIKDDIEVSLTSLEAVLVKKMLCHTERVVSKDDLVRSIGREPEHYRGLEMCLSRLQEKFKKANDGERLFRAVRNRGYCLIQKITYGKTSS